MATDFIAFNEGTTYLLTSGNGLPATCWFLLSTKPCSGAGSFTTVDTLVGGVGEITGSGYTRKSQAAPTPVNGVVSFALMTWTTGVNTNWPASVKSILLATTSDNTGKAICAWNLINGGAARDLSQANTTEEADPTLNGTS